MDVDVSLNECSKRWIGELGAEVQSVEGVVEWEESEGGMLEVLTVDQTSS